jgi:flagellin-specific chaperone FliS
MGKDVIKQFNQTRDRLADVYVDDKYQIERLRKILEKELGRPVSIQDAKEIGTDLVTLYKALAGERIITKGGLQNRDRLV